METEKIGKLRVRRHSDSGPVVIVLHGGPAGAGEAAPLAKGLADSFSILEPWQRGSDAGAGPLTVAKHVEDLHVLVKAPGIGRRPAIVGESWGAMLALAYAAEHPDSAGHLALVGCGAFDKKARARIEVNLTERMDDDLRRRFDDLAEQVPDPVERQIKRMKLIDHLYSYDSIDAAYEGPDEPFDEKAHIETWNDMVRLQEEGFYPAAFTSIKSPVIMLHGGYDPHPGDMIRASLSPFLPQLEYHEWEHCGHSPWLERRVRDDFFGLLREWLMR